MCRNLPSPNPECEYQPTLSFLSRAETVYVVYQNAELEGYPEGTEG
jgi:hypothetical protein